MLFAMINPISLSGSLMDETGTTVKFGQRGTVVWGCFSGSVPGPLVPLKGTHKATHLGCIGTAIVQQTDIGSGMHILLGI